MRALAKLAWVETKLFLREPLAAFFTLLFPLLLLALFGGIFGNAPVPEYGGFGFVDASVPAYAVLVIATSAFLSLTTTLASYREQGVLRRLHATPVRPLVILGAHVVVVFAMTALGMALLIALGDAAFGLRRAGSAPTVCAAFVFVSLSLFALGFVLASVAPGVRSAQAIGMTVFYPMIFLSGAAIPRDLLPAPVQRAAVVIPLTHAVTLLQSLWLGEPWRAHVVETGVLAVLGVVGVLVSARTFRWE